MRRSLYLILYIITVLTLTVSTARGQDNSPRLIYNQAEEEYDIGQLEQAVATLGRGMNSFEGTIRQSAYRLMALCWLGLDEPGKAQEWTRRLLNDDPYYTASAQDPQRFAEMIADIRTGLTAKITTASSQAESLSEVPVPTTLITEEMIHNSGAQNLQEVLAAYVPGMNIVDCNDDINIAMRGIYSNGQEKILIMLNGHRLNSYCTNIASPDFSISLEKIKQIEVLRGPASSLYGGVALTGVVNLITKQGADVDGVMIKGGIGNYGQLRGDALFGKRYFDMDLLVWGSIYRNSGQTMDAPAEMINDPWGIPEKEITVGHVGEKPSYDFGVQLKYKDLQLLYDAHFSEIIPPYSMSTLAKSYNHDKYRRIDGYSPSFVTKSHHAGLSYSRRLGHVNLKGTLTYDNSELTHYQVILDKPLPELSLIFGAEEESELTKLFSNPGLFRFISGNEQNYGFDIKGDYSYINTKEHQGSIAFGMEYSYFQLDDVRYTLGYNFSQLKQENPLISEEGTGHESNYNGFLQLKHQWRSVILNAGLRYDHKNRVENITLNEYSPRVALILLQPKWNVKLSYSRSFVDAPYIYRKINQLLPLLTGQTILDKTYADLEPEFVNSLQLTFAGLEWLKGLYFEVNGFYNRANNLIQTHIIDYANEGTNKTTGVEFLANYRNRSLTVDFNLTWTHTFKSNVYTEDINDNNNTPPIMSNAVVSWKVTPHLRLHTHVLFEGKQKTYNLDVVEMINSYKPAYEINKAYLEGDMERIKELTKELEEIFGRLVMQKEIPARVIFNIGAEYKWKHFTFGFNVRNLFNHQYYRSGMNTNVVSQKGRWFMFDVAYKF